MSQITKKELKLDPDWQAKLPWFLYVSPKGYVYYKGKLLHQHILPVEKGFIVDHINRDKLDNRRCNLRAVTYKQNAWNRQRNVKTRNTSGYKGVFRDYRTNRWQVYIGYNGKSHFGGGFLLKEEAALAYNTLAKAHIGEFALLNDIFLQNFS